MKWNDRCTIPFPITVHRTHTRAPALYPLIFYTRIINKYEKKISQWNCLLHTRTRTHKMNPSQIIERVSFAVWSFAHFGMCIKIQCSVNRLRSNEYTLDVRKPGERGKKITKRRTITNGIYTALGYSRHHLICICIFVSVYNAQNELMLRLNGTHSNAIFRNV